MNIAVCVKQIPDPTTKGELLADTHRLRRADVDAVLDPGDEYAVEAALRLAEEHGGHVTVVSMGPERAQDAIRKALSMGAQRGILVSDPSLEGADALTTATVLAAAVRRVSDLNLVLTATESTDGYSGVVPQAVAALLGWPALTFAKGLSSDGTHLTVERQTEDGIEVTRAALPAVASVTAGATEPRYPSLKGIMGAKSKAIERLTLRDLDLGAPAIGEHVISVVAAPEKAQGEKIVDDGTAAARIVEYLAQLKVI